MYTFQDYHIFWTIRWQAHLKLLSHLKPIYVVNGVIYLTASYNFFVNRPLCYVINQQPLQWAVYVVPRITTDHITLQGFWLHWHTESNTHTTFILFYYCLADRHVWQIKLTCMYGNPREFNLSDYNPSYVIWVLLYLMRFIIWCTLCLK